jgi:hypothetical protein
MNIYGMNVKDGLWEKGTDTVEGECDMEMNMIKVFFLHAWKYQNETPLYN